MSDEKEWTLIYWKGSLEFFSFLHFGVTHYQLYSALTKYNCPYAPNEGGKIPCAGQVFLYENPWILCIGSTFLLLKLTF